MSKHKLKVLVLCDFSGQDANVIRDYLFCFNAYSRHEYYYLHHWRFHKFQRVKHLDFNRFDVILLFWDYYWLGCAERKHPWRVPDRILERIAASKALKVQFLQDEYRDVRRINEVQRKLGVSVMFTCVPDKDHELFYPRSLIPSLDGIYPVLTGYVPAYLENVPSSNDEARPFDIGYRSRSLPYYLGSLAREKTEIAERFLEIAGRHKFTADISVREQDRIYGDRWLDFLRSCRCCLGTESGASVVDFDGTIRKRCNAYVEKNPAATFDEVKKLYFADLDWKVVIKTISPRLFESAAFYNTLVLHEGDYENMLIPDVHYIRVKKDYSNTEEVVERMRDHAFCRRLALNAHDELIASGKHSYRSFVQRFDAIIEKHKPQSSTSGTISRAGFYLTNYLHMDTIVPEKEGYRDAELSGTRIRQGLHHIKIRCNPAWVRKWVGCSLKALTRLPTSLLAPNGTSLPAEGTHPQMTSR